MGNIAIKLEKISKRYHIGRTQGNYQTLRDSISNAFVAPFRRVYKLLKGQATGAAELDEIIWALKDINIEIKQGEIVGLIGRNGAGKSTLLKILSRITEPTEGYAEIYGRVGSLLEVGTGFHPELTGRENIFLSGAILGMRKDEIIRKFDEIVAFAEIEKFIDTPVKHYSSGMYLRLAFAVAAHLEPEILLVDEVLAVGDARFQKKCISKMQDVGKEGRTVLFVSHNMPAVSKLCERAILLEKGRIIQDGPSHEVIKDYLSLDSKVASMREWDIIQAPGSSIVRLISIKIITDEGVVNDSFDISKSVGLQMEYEVLKPGYILLPHFHVDNEEGIRVFVTLDQDPIWKHKARSAGHYVSTAWIPGNFLTEGLFFVSAAIATMEPVELQVHEHQAVAFHVYEDAHVESARGNYLGRIKGVVRPLLQWTTLYKPNGNSKVRDKY